MKQISLFILCWEPYYFPAAQEQIREFEGVTPPHPIPATMEQANEKAKNWSSPQKQSPVAASLPRPAEGNFRTMPVQTVTATTRPAADLR